MILEIWWKTAGHIFHAEWVQALEQFAERSWHEYDEARQVSSLGWDSSALIHQLETFEIDHLVMRSDFLTKEEYDSKPRDYTPYIAEAATEYKVARSEHSLAGTEETRKAQSDAWEKLCWMIEAKQHGWNPSEYKPED